MLYVGIKVCQEVAATDKSGHNENIMIGYCRQQPTGCWVVLKGNSVLRGTVILGSNPS